jgi:hypothetical protein
LEAIRFQFLSLCRTDADRLATVTAIDWVRSQLNQKQIGRPKLQGPSKAALQAKCRLLAEATSPNHARTAFADRLTPKQIEAALGKNINGRIRKEYSANKLLAEFSG